MPPKRAAVTRIITAASTYIGVAVLSAWLADRITDSISRAMANVVNITADSVESTVDSLLQLVAPAPAITNIPQPTQADWMKQAVLDLEMDEPDDLDWVERAEEEINPGLAPERIFLPMEDRRTGPTGIPAPDLSGEFM